MDIEIYYSRCTKDLNIRLKAIASASAATEEGQPPLHHPLTLVLNKGHKVTKNVNKWRHSWHHGRLAKHTKFMSDITGEVLSLVSL
jgi:hypothetical protein